MRIKNYLAGMVVAMLLPLGIAAFFAIDKVREGERRAALEALHTTVKATTLVVEHEIQKSLGALEVLGRSEHFKSGNFEALYKQAQALNRLPNVWTLVLDETGTQVLNTAVPYGTPAPLALPDAKQLVTHVLATGRPFASDLLIGPVTGKLVTRLFVPANTANGKQYVVAQAFLTQHWKNVALRPETRPEWLVAVIDRTGRFIYRSQRSEELLGQQARPELVQALATQDAGLIMHSTLENVAVFDAYAHSKLTGWSVAVAAPVDSIESSGAAAVNRLLMGTFVALFGAGFFALFLGRKVIAAVDQASGAALDLAAGKPVNVQLAGLQEFNVLNRAMANAAGLLANAQSLREISEAGRQQLLDNERTAKLAAEEQNRRKDEFLAMLGHELRNPLAAIAAASYLLENNGDNNRLWHRNNAIIARQSKLLQKIVDDLLDVSRLGAGKIALNCKNVDLGACATACVDAIRDTAIAEGYTFKLDVDSIWVSGDLFRIDQIITNLLSNALKYSAEGTVIALKVKAAGDWAQLSVSDEGIGIQDDFLAHVFEPFVQGPSIETRMSSGLGIGLSLVKQLVELHGGKVAAESEGVGKGSQFFVAFPAISDANLRALQIETSVAPAPHNTTKLLLVEDNEDARLMMAELLEISGVSVTVASNGQQGLDFAAAEIFDVGLFDIGLPDMTGYELARQVHLVQPQMPVIALTGFGQVRDKHDAQVAGFVAHLTKPVAVEMLLEAIFNARK